MQLADPFQRHKGVTEKTIPQVPLPVAGAVCVGEELAFIGLGRGVYYQLELLQ